MKNVNEVTAEIKEILEDGFKAPELKMELIGEILFKYLYSSN